MEVFTSPYQLKAALQHTLIDHGADLHLALRPKVIALLDSGPIELLERVMEVLYTNHHLLTPPWVTLMGQAACLINTHDFFRKGERAYSILEIARAALEEGPPFEGEAPVPEGAAADAEPPPLVDPDPPVVEI